MAGWSSLVGCDWCAAALAGFRLERALETKCTGRLRSVPFFVEYSFQRHEVVLIIVCVTYNVVYIRKFYQEHSTGLQENAVQAKRMLLLQVLYASLWALRSLTVFQLKFTNKLY